MDDKDINSDSEDKSITDTVEDLFDTLFAPRGPDEVSGPEKENSAPGTAAAGTVKQKTTPKKPSNKRITPYKVVDKKKENPAPKSPPARKAQQKISSGRPLNKGVIPPDKTGHVKKQEAPKKEKELPSGDSGKSTAHNVFQKTRQESFKTTLLEKIKKSSHPLIFTLLIILLVLLSMFTGKIMDYDSILRFFNIDNSLTSGPVPVRIGNKHKEPAVVSRGIKITPLPESSAESKDIKGADPAGQTQTAKQAEENRADTVTVLLEKTADEPPGINREKILSYPYSIYLGSYRSIEDVKGISSDYRKSGITSYWIKLNLGEKGIWYRVFAGYFQTREEADEFIKTSKLQDAESRLTRYAILIGTCNSGEDAERRKTHLEELGYGAYIISDSPELFRIYTGAFYQRKRAEKQKNDMELNGIKSEVVER